MVELHPVRAWHPDPARVDPNQLVCPVYDTLSETDLFRYASHPFNAARFVPRPQGMTMAEFLVTAVGRLGEALTAGAYLRDERPAYYVYGIGYVPPPDILETIEPSHRRSRYLLLGLVGSLPFDSVQHAQVALHERTFEDRVEERQALAEATGMSFAPIMAGYHLPEHQLNDHLEHLLGLHRRSLAFEGSVRPVAEAVLDGTTHRIWKVDDPSQIERIREMVRGLRLLVLDGHHRFTAAARRFHGGEASAPLTMLVEGGDRALRVLPWHRVLPAAVVPSEMLNAAAAHEFAGVRELPDASVEALLEHLRVMHHHRHRGFLVAGGGEAVEVRGPASEDAGADFDLLHAFLEERLGVDPHALEFVRSPRVAVERVADGSGTALLLPGLTTRGIEERAFGRGHVMAHKSTMFLPKVAEGMIFAPADGVGDTE
jgi:Protein of unknown function (DUF1015)